MATKVRTLLASAFLLIVCFITPGRSMAATDAPGGKYALVIGNTDYGRDEVSGRADAKAMASVLREVGFTVLSPVLDADLGKMRGGLQALKNRISNASVVLVYYSGHGFRVGAANYLFPIGGTVTTDGSMSLDEITAVLATAPDDAVKLVFLDACRDAKELELPPNSEVGQAEILNPPLRLLYGFAAEAGRTAGSGTSKTRSPYTEALIQFIQEPGLEIRQFLAKVRTETIRLTSGRQAPADFGIGRLPDEFFLRPPVEVNARIDAADNAMVVFLNGELALQRSGDEGVKERRLRLRAGKNDLLLFVSNEMTFHNNQSWERPEGWNYRFQIYPADGQPLLCSEHMEDAGCFSAGEDVPFKSGPRHGKLFPVAKVNLFVDPISADLSFRDRDDTLWSQGTKPWATNQGVLFERKLFDLPLNRVLGDNIAALAVFILGFVAPDTNKILVTARGNLLAKEAVQTCMADEERWIPELRASVDRATVHHPRPFDLFDEAVTDCVKAEARKSPNPDLPPDEIRIYTAVEDRHGDPEPAPARTAATLAREVIQEIPPRGASAEGDLLADLAELFSPVRPEQHQLAAVRASRDQLQTLSGTLLYASLSAADLQAHLPAFLETEFKAGMGSGKAQVAKVELRDQEIVVWTAFEIARPEARVSLFGEAEVHCAAAIERGALVLRPSASTVHLTSARLGDGPLNLDLLKALLVPLMKGFLGDVSHVLETRRVPLRLAGLQSVDLVGLLEGTGSLIDVHAKPVDLNVGLGATTLLVDADGIHVLADAVVLTPERFARTVDELLENLERGETPRLTSAQLAALGECGQPLPLPESRALTFAAVCAAHSSLAQVESPTPAETPEEAEAVLRSELDAFRKKFLDKVDEIEPVARLPKDRTLVAISRKQLAAGLNEILQGLVVQATVRPPGTHAPIPPQTIRTPPKTDLHCDQVGGACPSRFEFRDYVPRGCPSNCGLFDLGCHRDKLECEVVKESEKRAYDAERLKALAEFGLEKAACEAVKAGKQIGCSVNQEWLESVAGLDVGELRGDVQVQDVEVPLTLDEVTLGTDLETLGVRLSVTGGGEVSGGLTVVPRNLGKIACTAPLDATLTARVHLPQQQRTLQLRRTGAGTETGDELRLTYQLSETSLDLQIDPPPIKAFLQQNAERLALSCPLPGAILSQLKGFPGIDLNFGFSLRDEILRDTFPFPVPAQEIPLVIPSQTVPIGDGEPIRLIPSWGEKSILFEAR